MFPVLKNTYFIRVGFSILKFENCSEYNTERLVYLQVRIATCQLQEHYAVHNWSVNEVSQGKIDSFSNHLQQNIWSYLHN